MSAPKRSERPVYERFLRALFFQLVVRPIVLVIVGVNVRHRERLPVGGPAILVANHNSHLDTMLLMCLFPLSMLSRLRPAAAADYFLRDPLISWFSTRVIGIIPVPRKRTGDAAASDPLMHVKASLTNGDIVIFFPEGTRGEPEEMVRFKSGIARLAENFPEVPVYPIFMHGLGKALPKGEALLVPFFCDAFVGEPVYWNGEQEKFLTTLQERLTALAQEGYIPPFS